MLVLTRRPHQTILFGDNDDNYFMKVKVLKIYENTVHLGIEAPDAINIVREEILIRGNR